MTAKHKAFGLFHCQPLDTHTRSEVQNYFPNRISGCAINSQLLYQLSAKQVWDRQMLTFIGSGILILTQDAAAVNPSTLILIDL